jgi:hypothetical protein
MNGISQLRPEFVEFIPDRLDQGVLYISRRYSTASHLCCCGCGRAVVTPLNPAKWHMTERGGSVSLTPSIGNWSFACQSHYWIDRNRIHWAAAMPAEQIAAVQARDRLDAEALARQSVGRSARFLRAVKALWAGLLAKINGAFPGLFRTVRRRSRESQKSRD